MDEIGPRLAAVPAVGIACLWVAARLGIPAILLLLPVGVGLGASGFLDPAALFGDVLTPAISLAVALLLFEGGLGLRIDQIGANRKVVVRLVTLGVLTTFAVGLVAAHALFDAPSETLTVLAAVLVVSGPTVVGPILAQVRPRPGVRSVLQWEGIVIDPIGATLALVVLGLVAEPGSGLLHAVDEVALTAATGSALGLGGGLLLVLALRNHLVPDHLQPAVVLAAAITVYALGELAFDEAGLFATTVMGVTLANQRWVTVAHVVAFNEVIGQVVLAGLFIVLGAAVEVDRLAEVAVPALALSAVYVVVARPLVVWAATLGSSLDRREQAFMAWMAPRGIVAASVAALFAPRLEEAGIDAEVLAPATFLVIVATVVLYGLTARPVARRLRVAEPPARALGLLGAPAWARALGRELERGGADVVVVPDDADEAVAARRDGLGVYDGPLTPEGLAEAVEVHGLRQVLATSSREERNELAVDRLAEAVGRPNLFVLREGPAAEPRFRGATRTVAARHAFGVDVGRRELARRFDAGWSLTTVPDGTSGGDLPAGALPLVHLGRDGTPQVLTGHAPGHRDGATVVLVPPEGGSGPSG
jgi:NhaP-type Na+/H+ or K+/H+ antiporter